MMNIQLDNFELFDYLFYIFLIYLNTQIVERIKLY